MKDDFTNILTLHVWHAFSGYAGWLPFVTRVAAERSVLTDEQRLRLRHFVDVLRQHATGYTYLQNDLFELACLVPGISRGRVCPILCLEESHGGFSDRRLRESVGWLEMASEILETLQLTKDVCPSLLEGIPVDEGISSDIFARLNVRLPARPIDLSSSLADAYRLIDSFTSRRLVGIAVNIASRRTKRATRLSEDILLHIASFRPDSFWGYHREFVERGIFHPSEIFRGADASVREGLLKQLNKAAEQKHIGALSRILPALAWIADDEVVRLFAAWRDSPPLWTALLYSSFSAYALEAGWQPDQTGRHQSLYFESCHRLISPTCVHDGSAEAVAVFARHNERCGLCNRFLTILFDCNLADKRLAFLASGFSRLRIITCDRCTIFTTIYGLVDERGGARWSPDTCKPTVDVSFEMPEYPQGSLVLGSQRRTPFEAHQFLGGGGSQIGGYPMWIQNAEYPSCPHCGQLMRFIGQVVLDEVERFTEGIIYAFLCVKCKVSATTYECS